MEVLLNKITTIIIEYRELGDKLVFDDTHRLSVYLKDLTSNLFFLEEHRDNYSRKYNSIQYTQTKEGNSVSSSEIIAKERVPELYKLRRFMTAAYKCADAIRSNISFLKLEQ